jgi:hypothetical protein
MVTRNIQKKHPQLFTSILFVDFDCIRTDTSQRKAGQPSLATPLSVFAFNYGMTRGAGGDFRGSFSLRCAACHAKLASTAELNFMSSA